MSSVAPFKDRDLVRWAVTAFRVGPADFSDYLIGEHDRRAGCTSTLTFDRRLAGSRGFEELDIGSNYPTRVSAP